jgi:Protein of unknown function (DUF2975)
MKKRTETILLVSRILAFMGFVGYSIVCGGQIVDFGASFINPEWARHTYQVDLNILQIREHSQGYFICAMLIQIAVSMLKASIWYVIFDLLSKLKMQKPFSIEVEKKLEKIAALLLAAWLMSSIFWKIFLHYLSNETGIQLSPRVVEDEYLFMAGIIYIISQVFKRGIEIEEENQLTV